MIERPRKVAVCLLGGDKERSLEQMKALAGLERLFEVEWSLRSDKFSGPYHSFSQVVNEAVVETESEFMVFINPKTIAEASDVETIVDDLRGGFCWSSVCSFGLWGATKELFRRIGLMDERFVGSEYEDNDFGIRMKQFGRAIKWRFDEKKYPWAQSVFHQTRGMTAGLYELKWNKEDGIYKRIDQFREEKRLPGRIQNSKREDIHGSWKNWCESEMDLSHHVPKEIWEAQVSDEVLRTSKAKVKSSICFESNFKVIFTCPVPTMISMVLAKGDIGEERRHTNGTVNIKSEHWYAAEPEPGVYDIRFFHEGKLIFNDMAFEVPAAGRTIDIGLNVTMTDRNRTG